jgi:hypothetical protein
MVTRGALLSKKQYTGLAEYHTIFDVWSLVSLENNFWALG